MKRLLVAFGLLETAFPDRIVASAERLAFDNPGEGTLRPWTLPMARLEGLVFCWLVLTGRANAPAVARTLGVIGVPAFLAPRRFVTLALGTAYENPANLELKSWVVPATRLLGVCYVAVALFSQRARTAETTDDSR
ncbi:hypothetical protein HALLA_19440 [Halostagnicola larsenii XH-48]|uniref:Uncharacterized protein n=1 Tax=Halostagnicola larsenii XH-48 TaxID=797299 RepID=W0JTJ8_9EURY|nr:hypothetical protein [Halostagnicola larsenii]AHG00637.1 hypothetical protein HALLA_19440 [Halostagnicola larsenii XH-48]